MKHLFINPHLYVHQVILQSIQIYLHPQFGLVGHMSVAILFTLTLNPGMLV
jgi:hypothetical protein